MACLLLLPAVPGKVRARPGRPGPSMATAAPRQRVWVRRQRMWVWVIRVLAQGEEGRDLDMLGEELVHPHISSSGSPTIPFLCKKVVKDCSSSSSQCKFPIVGEPENASLEHNSLDPPESNLALCVSANPLYAKSKEILCRSTSRDKPAKVFRWVHFVYTQQVQLCSTSEVHSDNQGETYRCI